MFFVTDVTGPTTATKALLVAYDIWGFSSQVIQGADILATADKDHQYQVFMPDFFDGEPCNPAWYVFNWHSSFLSGPLLRIILFIQLIMGNW